MKNDDLELIPLRFELDQCVPPCSIDDFDPKFVAVLDRMYSLYPFTVNSGYRSVDWEKKHKRPGTSSHCKGVAIDIRCRNGVERLALLRIALELGIKRIGVAKNFIHIDIDSEKPNSLWTYD